MAENVSAAKIPNIASDPSVPGNFVNMFRVRADKFTVVVDFSYFPPMDAQELQQLGETELNVSARILMPYELVPQLVEILSKTYDASKAVLAGQGTPATVPAPAAGNGPTASRVSPLRK